MSHSTSQLVSGNVQGALGLHQITAPFCFKHAADIWGSEESQGFFLTLSTEGITILVSLSNRKGAKSRTKNEQPGWTGGDVSVPASVLRNGGSRFPGRRGERFLMVTTGTFYQEPNCRTQKKKDLPPPSLEWSFTSKSSSDSVGNGQL